MTMRERRALRSLVVTLLLLLVASALAYAEPQVQEVETAFRPAPGKVVLAELRGDGAEIKISSPGAIREARARYRYDEEHFSGLLEWDADRSRLRAVLDMHGIKFEDSGEHDSQLDVVIPRSATMDLDVDLKAGVIDLDGEGMSLAGLAVRLWAGECKASFTTRSSRPMKRVTFDVKMGETDLRGLGNLAFEELDVNGFAGEIRVDLTGEVQMNRRVYVDLEMGSIEVIVPAGAAVEARISKLGFLSEVTIPRDWGRDGRYAYSPATMGSEPTIVLDIRGGIGEITIRER